MSEVSSYSSSFCNCSAIEFEQLRLIVHDLGYELVPQTKRLLEEESISPTEGEIVLYIFLSLICIVCAALAAGLTQG